MKKEVTLRQVGGSLALSVPADFVRAFRLSPGDRVTWEGDEDGATVKFFRVEVMINKTPALMEQVEETYTEERVSPDL
jgi:antitoxin component of MazEF toxin-antitoxin module